MEGVDQSGQEASFAFHLRGVVTALTSSQSRIEQIPQRITEHVEAVNGNRQGNTRPERQPGRLLHVSTSIPAEHASPAWNIGRQTISEKAQRRFGNNDPPDHDRQLQANQGHHRPESVIEVGRNMQLGVLNHSRTC